MIELLTYCSLIGVTLFLISLSYYRGHKRSQKIKAEYKHACAMVDKLEHEVERIQGEIERLECKI